MEGRVSRAEYTTFLHEVGHVHRELDAALDRHASSHPLLVALVRDEHRRSPRIAADLAALGASGPAAHQTTPLPATASFVRFLRDEVAADPSALVGVLYVTEGATNGNKVIAKAVQSALALGPGEAMGYLDPHGAEQRRRWMEFKAALDALPVSAAQRATILAAARRTFQYFIDLSPLVR